MDFLLGQALLYSGEEYSSIYGELTDKKDRKIEIKFHDLFSICATLGFKHGVKGERKGKGKEFRTNYLSTAQRSMMYVIVLRDPELGNNLAEFADKDFQSKARATLEQYAIGGMQILIRDVFKFRWDGRELDRGYDEYEVDILSYIYQDAQEVPF